MGDAAALLPNFDDPQVQLVYRTLCNDDLQPPYTVADHWEGWIARQIVAAQRAIPDAAKDRIRAEAIEECAKFLERTGLRNPENIARKLRALASSAPEESK